MANKTKNVKMFSVISDNCSCHHSYLIEIRKFHNKLEATFIQIRINASFEKLYILRTKLQMNLHSFCIKK